MTLSNGDPGAIRTRGPQIRNRDRKSEITRQSCKTDQNQPTENQSVSGGTANTANRVQEAAMWLHLNRSALVGPAIPVLKERFGLRNLEAIEATKQAHALAYPGA